MGENLSHFKALDPLTECRQLCVTPFVFVIIDVVLAADVIIGPKSNCCTGGAKKF